MPKLYYFQAPSFSIDADCEIAPRLGSIFYSLERLIDPLNQHDHLYIPKTSINTSKIEKLCETKGTGYMAAVGLNANIANGIGGSADVVYALATEKKTKYCCESLETVEFEPSEQFIIDSVMASQRVQATLDKALFGRKRIYMITGLKIATRFSSSTSESSQHGPKMRVGIDATGFGIPVAACPEVELATSRTRSIIHGRTRNKIIFAYRVVRIKQGRSGDASWKYRSGGKYGLGQDEDEDEDVTWEVEALDEENVYADS
ncbi:hypothetical protein FB567DRAFT_546185 [Paraphoma chrysanthemicola]|uniref:Uncharacterized protein n=1 Tax=Paraphoma chrysanthemicola TaxID=798071 RepID=A0A8K0REC7_9PLEO|nr:hypothetical protein FB567DRAFT_546185 [Paraphoma chrysanthemicola]